MTPATRLCLTAAVLSAPASYALAASETCSWKTESWLTMSDADFAAACVETAFGDSLEARQELAWMFFARVNQLIDDPEHPDGDDPKKTGMSGSGQVPVWMAWPTDPDTFATAQRFDFDAPPRDAMKPSEEKKDILAGRISTEDPDGANEEVTRNKTSYDYLIDSGLTTKRDVHAFFTEKGHDFVDMPVGSIELKASWLQVTDGSPAPEGALTFEFDSGEYWWRGLHIMVKMQSLSEAGEFFYSETPSWFWTTFEFNRNPGVDHVRARPHHPAGGPRDDPLGEILGRGPERFRLRGVRAQRHADPLYGGRRSGDTRHSRPHRHGGFRGRAQHGATALLDPFRGELPRLPRDGVLQPGDGGLLPVFGAHRRARPRLQHGRQQTGRALSRARLPTA